jgi:hypothetical protein
MSDDTVTGWRTRLLRAWAWAVANRDYSIPLVAFVVGAILGKLL